ncbi:DNA polymerase epsilon catalytic subunit [Coemansia furcata]|nr:DNA polymerase epsilon catalytic subunit [Coemansia furcata]
MAKPLFEHLVLNPLQYWTFLLWMNQGNYGGVVAQDGEPRIEMLWGVKEYLPPLVQTQFELVVAEFIYKLAAFHDQLRARNPHVAQPQGVDAIEDDDDDVSKPGEDTVAKGAFYRRLIGQHFTRKLLDAVPRIRDACTGGQDEEALFPRLPGSKMHGTAGGAALEFVKYVSAVFALDVPATNFVRIMRRNLLVLLDVGEFSDVAAFVDPCARLVLARVVCDFCNYCRDMDFCRDADLLPTPQGLPEWECLGCGGAYDRVRIEERLIEQLQALLLAFQIQDLVCGKCRLMKKDNFSVQCMACAGKYQAVVRPEDVRRQIAVYRDVAELNRLPMLHDLAKWANDNSGGKQLLCTVGVAREHPLLDPEMSEEVGTVCKIEFAPSVKSSLIQGKAKKNSLKLMPDTKICTVTTTTGKEFIIRAAIRGLLMEWNARLESEPQLLALSPHLAFVAIIKPPTDDDARILSECVAKID